MPKPMKVSDWKRYPRIKKELLCPHGIGHGGIHGCDGCCDDPSFREAWKKIFGEEVMKEYHKIQSLYKRDEKGKFIIGSWSMPELEYLKNNLWEFTEKVDGTNIRVMFDGDNVTFGGKTDNAQIPAYLVTALNNQFMTLPKRQIFKEKFPDGVCLYGEGYGAKIQKGGGNYRPDQGFVLFDVLVGDWWLKREDVEDTAKALGIDVVPVIKIGTLYEAEADCKKGFKSTWGDFEAEGYVLRPLTPLFGRNGKRVITKVKCKDFL